MYVLTLIDCKFTWKLWRNGKRKRYFLNKIYRLPFKKLCVYTFVCMVLLLTIWIIWNFCFLVDLIAQLNERKYNNTWNWYLFVISQHTIYCIVDIYIIWLMWLTSTGNIIWENSKNRQPLFQLEEHGREMHTP